MVGSHYSLQDFCKVFCGSLLVKKKDNKNIENEVILWKYYRNRKISDSLTSKIIFEIYHLSCIYGSVFPTLLSTYSHLRVIVEPSSLGTFK